MDCCNTETVFCGFGFAGLVYFGGLVDFGLFAGFCSSLLFCCFMIVVISVCGFMCC